MNLPTLLAVFLPIFATNFSIWQAFSAVWPFIWFTQLSVGFLLSILSWKLAYSLLEHFQTSTVSPEGKTVLITGCDTGFGHDLASRLDALGFTVYAGVLFPEGDGALRLTRHSSTRLQIVKMDVTKAEEVEKVVESIRSRGESLWAVVNNAGIGFGAFFDWGADISLYRRLFEVNVFGLIRISKATIPLLRQSKGRLINVGSLCGRLSLPTMAHYNMAKAAVRVFGDTVRREFALTGSEVKLITIEPVFYKTAIIQQESMKQFRQQAFDGSPEEIKDLYRKQDLSVDDWFSQLQTVIDQIARPNLGEVTDAIEKAVLLERPKLFYRCSGTLDTGFWAVAHLPEVIIDYFCNQWLAKKFLCLLVFLFGKQLI